MRGIFASFAGSAIARGALAVALATGVVAGGMTVGVGVAEAKKEKAPKPGTYSKEFSAAATPLQKTVMEIDAIKKRKGTAEELRAAAATGPAELAAAEAAIQNPTDRMGFGNWALMVGGALGDSVLQQRGIQSMLASGLVAPGQVTEFQFYVGSLGYNNRDYQAVVGALPAVVAANYADDSAAELLADAYDKLGQPVQGLDALKSAIAARQAAGGVVPENWYTRGNTIAYNAKLGEQSVEWSRMLAGAYPSDIAWLGAGQVAREFGGEFGNQESVDLGRLFVRTGGLRADPKFAEREYVEYIEAASKVGLPAEVVKIAQMGVDAGVLNKTDPFVADAVGRTMVASAEKDRAAAAADERAARASADGKSALATGDVYLSLGDAAKAEEMFKLALEKNVADRDRALTRLGIAQIDQDKFAEAKATLAQVGGIRTNLAKLFWAYADSEERATAQ